MSISVQCLVRVRYVTLYDTVESSAKTTLKIEQNFFFFSFFFFLLVMEGDGVVFVRVYLRENMRGQVSEKKWPKGTDGFSSG